MQMVIRRAFARELRYDGPVLFQMHLEQRTEARSPRGQLPWHFKVCRYLWSVSAEDWPR